MGIVDSIVVGHYSSIELAGVAAGNSIFWMIVMIGFGSIGRGTLPLIQRHFEHDPKRFVVIDPDNENQALAEKHGFELARFRAFEKVVTDEAITRARKARLTAAVIAR